MEAIQLLKWYERNKVLMDFLAEKSREAQGPVSMSELSRVFVATTNQNIALSSMKFKISRLRQKIPSMEVFDKETRLKMMFVLSAELDDEYLNELRKDALVEVDGQKRIVKYKANDGSLEFEGDQSRSAKIRYGREAIQKRSLISQQFQAVKIEDNPVEKVEETQLYLDDESDPVLTKSVLGESSNFFNNERKRKEFLESGDADEPAAKKQQVDQEHASFPASYVDIMKAGQSITDTTSVQEFLTMMKFIVEDLQSPILSALQQKINAKIAKYKDVILRIPVVDVLNTFLITVRVATKYELGPEFPEVSTNLRDFLVTIQIASTSMNTRGLAHFESEMEKASTVVGEHQRISVEKVRSGLDLAVEYILP